MLDDVQLNHPSGDLDPDLWFPCAQHPGSRDLLYPSSGNTFAGRMPAWCETGQVSYRVSIAELPDDLPPSTLLWIRGFLAGSVPGLGDADLAVREREADEFLATGYWPG